MPGVFFSVPFSRKSKAALQVKKGLAKVSRQETNSCGDWNLARSTRASQTFKDMTTKQRIQPLVNRRHILIEHWTPAIIFMSKAELDTRIMKV